MTEALTVFADAFQGFCGFPAAPDLDKLAADIAILGIPNGVPYRDLGNPYRAESAAMPRAVRYASNWLVGDAAHYDFDLDGVLFDGKAVRAVDCGDVAHDPTRLADSGRWATEATAKILAAGALPIMIGGDDAVPIPFFRAFKDQGPITIVQVDSHIDWRHEVGGITEGYSSTMRRASEMPWFTAMVQIGQRGVGSARPQEVRDALTYGSRLISARAVHAKGIDWVLDQVPGDRFLITIDCDGLDPAVMPAVNALSPGGLAYFHVIDLVHGLARRGRIVGFDIVELAPRLDLTGVAALAVARIIRNLIGAVVRSGQVGR
ncbi:MAG: arginase [Alphaproteobacteria bacterium]|nr:arginase [Alphaproteobacteria bacterium]